MVGLETNSALSSAGLEQQPSKLWVAGSNPAGGTIFEKNVKISQKKG